jgi:trehalose 6-phosphate phosphatase
VKEILRAANRGVLRRLADARALLAFDYDGTLAPLVDEPDRAAMRSKTRDLFGKLTQVHRCAVLSGRALADIRARLGQVDLVAVIGNHGAEAVAPDRRHRQRVRRWLPRLERELGPMTGVRIEDKGYSLSVHYRHAPNPETARAAVHAVAARLPGVRVQGGKLVVNLLPEGAPHKGMALASLMDRRGLDTALYVGDDDTDEDVFASASPDRVVGVRVGRRKETAARYWLPRQRDVDRLLEVLLELPRRPPA